MRHRSAAVPMTVDQMAREVVDLWMEIGGPCDPSIENCCYQLLYDRLDPFWFNLVQDAALEIADDEVMRSEPKHNERRKTHAGRDTG